MAERIDVAATISVTDQATAAVGGVARQFTEMAKTAKQAGVDIDRDMGPSKWKAVGESLGGVGRAFGNLGSQIKNIVTPLATLLGIGAGFGIYEATQSLKTWVDTARELPATAARLGTTSEELQKWQYVARQANVDAGTFETAMDRLQKSIGKATRDPKSDIAGYFAEAQIPLRDAEGRIRSVTDVMPELIRNLQKQGDATTRNNIRTGLFGRGMEDLDKVFGTSTAQIAEWVAAADEVAKISDEDSKKAAEYAAAQRQVGDVFHSLGLEIFPQLVPAITEMTKEFAAFFRENKKEIVEGVVEAFKSFVELMKAIPWKSIIDSAKGFMDWLKEGNNAANLFKGTLMAFAAIKLLPIVTSLIDLGGAAYTLGTNIATALGIGLTPFLAALGALGIAAYTIWDNWDVLKGYWDTFWEKGLGAAWDQFTADLLNKDSALRERIRTGWVAREWAKFQEDAWKGLQGDLDPIFGWFNQRFGDMVPKNTQEAWDRLRENLPKQWNAIKEDWQKTMNWLWEMWNGGISDALSRAWENIKTVLERVWGQIKSIWDSVMGPLWDAWSAVQGFGGRVGGAVAGAWKEATEWFGGGAQPAAPARLPIAPGEMVGTAIAAGAGPMGAPGPSGEITIKQEITTSQDTNLIQRGLSFLGFGGKNPRVEEPEVGHSMPMVPAI